MSPCVYDNSAHKVDHSESDLANTINNFEREQVYGSDTKDEKSEATPSTKESSKSASFKTPTAQSATKGSGVWTTPKEPAKPSEDVNWQEIDLNALDNSLRSYDKTSHASGSAANVGKEVVYDNEIYTITDYDSTTNTYNLERSLGWKLNYPLLGRPLEATFVGSFKVPKLVKEVVEVKTQIPASFVQLSE